MSGLKFALAIALASAAPLAPHVAEAGGLAVTLPHLTFPEPKPPVSRDCSDLSTTLPSCAAPR
ncbi:hypothetical protein [Profundibacterium mesophilum]|uniref:Uncharacterized protein n=1 Tax=Profundibacterium mesophilum KAUST100406-0324 TaxID=1037889 RepID=A0A921NRT7_9RHOB|nr:hypothetical protein [Profundibacterium mesophilum]KAF0676517.1 hypothetical protein PMES_01249 [Profundibacterium mesophilum KAUST100406-0324]